MENKKSSGLWTRDFTIITIGSLISMVGSSLAGFSISLLVLDYTGSTFLYSLFIVCYQLPMMVVPVLAGPYLDRMSRKKAIYMLDFTTAGFFLLLFILLELKLVSYPLLLIGNIIIGTIFGVYNVAYESFYPNLITEGNYRQAYSVSSMLYPLAAMSTPIAAAIYNSVGSAGPIFAVNTMLFFIAACFERTIKHEETHIVSDTCKESTNALSKFKSDLLEGFDYLKGERGLLCIVLYFMFSGLCGAAENLVLPYFKNHPERFASWPIASVTLYAIISNFGVAGRLTGAFVQYKVAIPANKKYDIALTVYSTLCILSAVNLFLPVSLMALCSFMVGILGVTSYTIRTAATQAYVPDNKRARFNGIFSVVMSTGAILGSLLSGACAEYVSERTVLVVTNAIGLFFVYILIYKNKKYVSFVYNRDV